MTDRIKRTTDLWGLIMAAQHAVNWLFGISLLALLTSPALAQTAPDDTSANTDIVVTARRVQEKLSDVPASITAFDTKQIERANIQRAADFIKLTPGVTIVVGTDEAAQSQIDIRGINGARDAESSVALVVDGILKTNNAALNQNQGTVRQIEVLKGPQGALYGRNAAAGAIVLQTRKPGDALEASFRGSYANNNMLDGSASLSGPLAPDAGFVVSGNYRQTDGFFRNAFLGNSKTVDDQKVWDVDGRIIAQIGNATTIDAKAHYGEFHGASINFNASFQIPAFAAANGVPQFYENVNDHPFRYYSNIRPTNDQSTVEGSVKIEHDFGSSTLSAWGLYSNVKNALLADGTSADFQRFGLPAANAAAQPVVNSCATSTAALTGYPLNAPTFIGVTPFSSIFGAYSPTTCDGAQYQRRRQEDYSGEIRLASNSSQTAFSWQFGGYYLHINRDVAINLMGDAGRGVIAAVYNAPSSISPTTQLYHDKFTTDVFAGFASGSYAITEGFDLNLALRYDIEKRRVDNEVPLVLDPFTGGPINPGQVTGPIVSKKQTFEQLEPKITARYKFGPAATIYANWGVGFKSGGFNNQGSAQIIASAFNSAPISSEVRISDTYRKERSSAYEAGIKGRFGPVDYGIAGYYTQVRDMQFFEFFVGGFGLLRVVSNIDRVDLKGVEGNANLRVVKGFDLFGAFNITDSEIKRNTSRPSTVGNKSPYTADYTINLGTQMTAPIAATFDLLFRADYRITGPTWFHTVQDQTNPTIFGAPGQYGAAKREAFGVLDLRLGFEGRTWNVAAYATNILDRNYLAEVIPAVEFGGSFVSPGARRSYGVQLGYKF